MDLLSLGLGLGFCLDLGGDFGDWPKWRVGLRRTRGWLVPGDDGQGVRARLGGARGGGKETGPQGGIGAD